MARYKYFSGAYNSIEAIGSETFPNPAAGTFHSYEANVEGVDSRYQTGSNTIITSTLNADLVVGGIVDPNFPIDGKPAGAAYCNDTAVMPNCYVGDPTPTDVGVAASALSGGLGEAARYTIGWVDIDSYPIEEFTENALGFYDTTGGIHDITMHSPFGLQSHFTLVVPGSIDFSKSTLNYTTIVYHIPATAKGLAEWSQNIHVTGNELGRNFFPTPQVLPTPTERAEIVAAKMLFLGYGLFLGDVDVNNDFSGILGTPIGWNVG